MLSRTSSGRRVANISVQATPVYVSCEFLSRLPGAPDRGRYVGRKARPYALRNL
jgi:hypothetical protein